MAANMKGLAAAGVPHGLPAGLLTQIKTLFIESFQHIYMYSFVITILTFLLSWFLKKEVLSTKSEEENLIEEESRKMAEEL